MGILYHKGPPKSQKVQLMEQGDNWELQGTSMSTWVVSWGEKEQTAK